MVGLSSIVTLAVVTAQASSSEIWSRAGAICLQGPHHSAQKSTRTGVLDCSTSFSKLSSVTFTVLIKLLPIWVAGSQRPSASTSDVSLADLGINRIGGRGKGFVRQVFWDRHQPGSIGPHQGRLHRAIGEDGAKHRHIDRHL